MAPLGGMMKAQSYFSRDYAEARARFLEAARAAGARVESTVHPLRGPAGEELAMDAAWIGAEDAPRVLVLGSGTHGVEGFCGSGCQLAFLARLAAEMPAGIAVLLTHAHNPYGFAHLRRVTEENVDLNRNFIDHDAGHPANDAYDAIHGFLLPEDWDGPGRQAADRAMMAFIASRGLETFQAAVSGGQYDHPDGLFYGGLRPVWSNRVMRAAYRKYLAGRDLVALIDYHTGLGPRGHGELIDASIGGNIALTRDWYGADEVTSPAEGGSVSAPVSGVLPMAAQDVTGRDRIGMIAIEYGTIELMEVLTALRGDNWLYLHGDVSSPLGREIKAEMRRAFYGEDEAWCRDVLDRSEEIIRKALAGLGGS